ncbi:DUF5711 family protein [Tissierella sp.]|uniref:DUF5711 family protein n=1 Tax=Tissierella sp. TaxID=41274 RepID=UPI0028624E49|nr:DUF5711 family protein [Tissierella sp.]MDR7857325.1 DUF5711 family protein [Tissierella sp.]
MEESKKSNHKGFKIFIAIFLVLSLIFLKEENQTKIIKFLDSFSGGEKVLKLVDSFTIHDDIMNINIYDGTIVKWDNSKLTYLKTDGTIVLEKEFNFDIPFIYYGDKYIYVGDKSTGDIYSLDSKGETIDRLQLNKEIFNIKESHGNFIYHTKSLTGESINILDKDGILIGNYSFEDKNILEYTTNSSGSKHSLALLDLNGEVLKTQIHLFGEDKESLGSIDIENEITVYLGFVLEDELIALTDKSLYFIKDGKIMLKKQFDLIKDIYLGKEEIYILYSNYLEVIDFDGRTQHKIGFTQEYNKLIPFDNRVLIYGDNNLELVEGKEHILKHNEDFQDIFVGKGQILIWGSDEIKTYEVSNKK